MAVPAFPGLPPPKKTKIVFQFRSGSSSSAGFDCRWLRGCADLIGTCCAPPARKAAYHGAWNSRTRQGSQALRNILRGKWPTYIGSKVANRVPKVPKDVMDRILCDHSVDCERDALLLLWFSSDFLPLLFRPGGFAVLRLSPRGVVRERRRLYPTPLGPLHRA